ncbi:MAG: transposase [Bdellovibrionales bacterium]|nr:transposase [Bdellovibrionales bacterium]
MREPKTYSQDFKDKVVKEYKETGSLTAVARSHSIPVTTLRQWVTKHMPKKPQRIERQQVERLEKELASKTIENEILKELLKKTNRAWLKD